MVSDGELVNDEELSEESLGECDAGTGIGTAVEATPARESRLAV